MYPQRGFHTHNTGYEFRQRIAYSIFNSVKIIQRAWRTFKLRPETWAKRVWNMVRYDSTPDEKKCLCPRDHRDVYDLYVWYIDQKILAKDVSKDFLNRLYNNHVPYDWAEKKKYQLWERLLIVVYIVVFIELHLKGYRIVECSDWSHMLKWLSNPEYHRIVKYLNNGNVNFVRSSEYGRYMCKIAGKAYPYESLEIDYYKSGYLTIEGKLNSIDFSDSKNNCKYVQRVF